jgi:hypothetical protein
MCSGDPRAHVDLRLVRSGSRRRDARNTFFFIGQEGRVPTEILLKL